MSLPRNILACAAAGCALTLAPIVAGAQDATPAPSTPPEAKMDGLNNTSGSVVKLTSKEESFVKKAGAGNSAEIQMAETALKNSQNQDVKDFAQMMIKDHTSANDDLSQVAKNHNLSFPPAAPVKEVAMDTTMMALSGATFDKAYVKHMVAGHTKVLAEYKAAAGEVKDPMLVAYVQKVTPTVEEHLKAAEELEGKLK